VGTAGTRIALGGAPRKIFDVGESPEGHPQRRGELLGLRPIKKEDLDRHDESRKPDAVTTGESDAQLLARWRNGDGGAGGALVRRHFRSLRRFFASKAHGYEEDLVQQVFIACVEGKDALGDHNFGACLFGLAKHKLTDHYRKVYRQQRFNFIVPLPLDLEAPPSMSAIRHEEHEVLRLALGALPADQQRTLELTYWDELTAQEAGEVLGIPANTVYSRLRRAKAHLREAMQRSYQVFDP
jgi:RNA polymerase sigma-70 factor (ECF subfamily)